MSEGQIISSYNVFVDTDRGTKSGDSSGDNFNLHLNEMNIDADKGQYIRLTVNNFSMYRNFPNVNANNNEIRLVTDVGPGDVLTTKNLTAQHYANFRDVGLEFAEQVRAALQTVTGVTATVNTATLTPSTTTVNGTSSRIIIFDVDFAANHGLSKCLIQFLEPNGDSYALLGGDRIASTADVTTSSVTVTTAVVNKVTVTCKYPCQRSTSQFVYLRTDLPSNGIESISLAHSGATTNSIHDVIHSDILARFPMDTEFVQYDAGTGREYFMNLTTVKHLQNIHFRLTDEHNRPLPVYAGQNTLGNLSFTLVMRVDIVQARQPAERFTPDPIRTVPPRMSTLMISP